MGPQAATNMTLSERADALEEQMMHELERIVTKSVLFNLADGKIKMESGPALQQKYPGKYMLMRADPRLPQMPEKSNLIDFFKLFKNRLWCGRFSGTVVLGRSREWLRGGSWVVPERRA